jgi:hypothetical protein
MKWISQDEYMKKMDIELSELEDLIENSKLNVKVEDGIRFIEDKQQTSMTLKELSTSDTKQMVAQPEFVEKTIGTIISLHEKVLEAKDETISSIKEENKFLKEALESLQTIYEEDRKTIKALQTQLELSQQEVEFMRRKYKLMWNKAIDEQN